METILWKKMFDKKILVKKYQTERYGEAGYAETGFTCSYIRALTHLAYRDN